ncbi:MAG: DUF2461 domain-containing protein [Bacteroidetes bacterium]|nr:DUF2461 domain-containing protein [Bacteroidota bacterium]
MLQAATIKFLKDLKKNNNKPWFDANRKQYETAKEDFEGFVQKIIDKHTKKDSSLKELKAKNCLFRINRDVRFSKDKSPYKTNFGAHINSGGKKSILGGYYFHLEPSDSFVGGGIWMPMPPELKKIRQEIDYNFNEFKKIIGSKKFKSVYGDLSRSAEYSLVNVPQGFEKDDPAAEYLKLKSFVGMKKIKEADLTSKELEKQVVEAFEALQPLVEFINRGLKD